MEDQVKRLTIVLILGLLIAAGPVWGMSGTTNEGYVACHQEQWLRDMVSFVGAKDMDSFEAYIKQGRCLIMRGGMKVTVTDSPGMFGGRTGFVFQGAKMWTLREGINYGQ